MAKIRLERSPAPLWFRTLIPMIAIPVTFALTSVLILWAGANPLSAYYEFLISPLSSRVSLIEVLVKSTPLLLTGARWLLLFRPATGILALEGQLYAGAMVAAWLGHGAQGCFAFCGYSADDLGGVRGRCALGAHPGPA